MGASHVLWLVVRNVLLLSISSACVLKDPRNCHESKSHSNEKNLGNRPEAIYLMPALSRCLFDGATKSALASA